MPEGRFVSKSISINTELASVSLEADYLFGRCIPHLDRDGRMSGNPIVVKSTACPIREEIDSGSIPELLRELAGVGLVRWYRANGKEVLEFPGFQRNQKGMRYDREAEGRFPPMTSDAEDLVRTKSGAAPDPVRINSGSGPAPARTNSGNAADQIRLSEVKSSEVKSSDGADAPTTKREFVSYYSGVIRQSWPEQTNEEMRTNASILGHMFGKVSGELEAAIRGLPIARPSTRPSMRLLWSKEIRDEVFTDAVRAHYEAMKPRRTRDQDDRGPEHISVALSRFSEARSQ